MAKLNRQPTLEIFYDAVLAALDDAAQIAFDPLEQRAAGATDQDLPRLFKAITEQVELLAKRYGAELVDIEED